MVPFESGLHGSYDQIPTRKHTCARSKQLRLYSTTLRSSGSRRATTAHINRCNSQNPKPSNPKPLLLRPGPGQGCKWGRSSPRTTLTGRASAGMVKGFFLYHLFSTWLQDCFSWQSSAKPSVRSPLRIPSSSACLGFFAFGKPLR